MMLLIFFFLFLISLKTSEEVYLILELLLSETKITNDSYGKKLLDLISITSFNQDSEAAMKLLDNIISNLVKMRMVVEKPRLVYQYNTEKKSWEEAPDKFGEKPKAKQPIETNLLLKLQELIKDTAGIDNEFFISLNKQLLEKILDAIRNHGLVVPSSMRDEFINNFLSPIIDSNSKVNEGSKEVAKKIRAEIIE